MNVGIIGYGVYIPKYRIKVSEIASVWRKKPSDLERSLGLVEKSVAGQDEDTVTLAFEAATSAINSAGIFPKEIEVCFVGSESHPYAVNPTSTIVGEFLGLGKNYLASDLGFACKAGTSGIIAIASLISAAKASFGLAIGSDTAQAKPHDILEYSASCAAAAFLLGKNKDDIMAKLIDFSSFSSDTPDFWRRDGVRFPSHGGRFTGEPAYFAHIEGAAGHLLQKVKMKPSDFDFCVFHMPNGKFPREIVKRLGFREEQLIPSLIVGQIGNPYAASSLIGLAKVLDKAKPGQQIFMASYGSGAGSDAFVWEVTENIKKRKETNPTIEELIRSKKYISYTDYLRFTRRI